MYILLSVIILSVFALGKIVKAILVVTIMLHTDPLKDAIKIIFKNIF